MAKALLVALSILISGAPRPTATATSGQADWHVVRSVPSRGGGPIDLVLIPEARKRDTVHYTEIANMVCGKRATCMVFFWTDRNHVPISGDMPVPDLQAMTATYERDPAAGPPVLQLSCWLFTSKDEAEKAKCGHMLGEVLPWEKK